MGASNSRPEEDVSLKLCHDRMMFVKKAIGCRCMLAEAHLTYIQTLKETGICLLEFTEPRVPIESDPHDSTDENKEPLVPNQTHSNVGSPGEIEKTVSSPADESVTVPNENHQDSVSAPSPWDFFDLSLLGDDQLSARKINGSNEGLDRGGDRRTTLNAEDKKTANEPNLNNISEIEEEDEINFVSERNFSTKNDKDYDEGLFEDLVGSFENINLMSDIFDAVSTPSITSVSTEVSEIFPMARSRSPDLSPLREIAPSVSETVHLTKLADIEEIEVQENIDELNASPNALYSIMKDAGQLFLKASECGQEVLRMLEANRLHFHRPVPKRKGVSKRSWCLITCICHREESNHVSREIGQDSNRYLTSRRNVSAGSFSSIASQNPRDDSLANSNNDMYCMTSGSHVSTLERLYAWERKLYDEVKASISVRRQYDQKCKLLSHQESKAESAKTVDKTRAVIKDLHSRIIVSIKRMETISSRIIRIRDSELQPQFEELIKGLGTVWQKMHEFHKCQYEAISATLTIPIRTAINSDDRRWIKQHLERKLSLTSTNYTRLIYSYKLYLKEIEGWLLKCILFPENSSKKTSKRQHKPISEFSPPILITCRSWLEGLEKLAAETSNLSSRQDKHHGENTGNTSNSVEESNNICRSIVQILGQLMMLSESSANMYNELDKSIQEASSKYEQLRKPQPP